MKKIGMMFALLGALLFVGVAQAQTAQGFATISWTLPTLDTNGQPLTGANALTSVQLFISPTSIASGSAMAPSVTLPSAGGTIPPNYTYTGVSGSTIFVRAKACNAAGCSVLSTQASAVLPFPSAPPAPPTSVTITLSVTQP